MWAALCICLDLMFAWLAEILAVLEASSWFWTSGVRCKSNAATSQGGFGGRDMCRYCYHTFSTSWKRAPCCFFCEWPWPLPDQWSGSPTRRWRRGRNENRHISLNRLVSRFFSHWLRQCKDLFLYVASVQYDVDDVFGAQNAWSCVMHLTWELPLILYIDVQYTRL